MSILIDQNTHVLIQGITGKEGMKACKQMQDYGTSVVAGVTPGKGRQVVEGVPVYNSVAEAKLSHAEINCALIIVPAPFVKDAVMEATYNDIPLVNVFTEHVSMQDSAEMLAHARKHGTRIVGPSSMGIVSPGKAKVSSIGGIAVNEVFAPGSVGLLSKSGGMTAEIGVAISRAGLGLSTAMGIGGDAIAGSDFLDLLLLFEEDAETKACVIFGEIGGVYEEKVADAIKDGRLTKPLVALIAGRFTKTLPEGTVLGHAGTIVAKGRGDYDSKINALTEAGAHVAHSVEEIPAILKTIL